MALSKFGKASAAGGSRFGGGAAAASKPAGKFGGRAAPEPEEEAPAEEEQPPQRGAGKFGRTQNAPAGKPGAGRFGGAAGGRQGRAPGGRFTGIRSAKPQTPLLGENGSEGEHRVQCVATFEKQSEKSGDFYCHVMIKIVESETAELEQEFNLLFATSGKGARRGSERLMSFVCAMAGFADDEAFMAAIPNYDQLIGAVCGEAGCEQCEGPNGQPFGENPLADAFAFVRVTKGGLKQHEDGTSTQYYNYEWAPAEAF